VRRSALLLALAAGCAAAPPPHPRVDARPAADSGPTLVSPARWSFHPAAPITALSAVKVDDGCVLTAEGGQRWSSASTKIAGSRLVCAGKAEASSTVAPEDLTSAIRRKDGSWIFVGASGALFEAAEALGPFTRVVPAPEPLARVTGAGSGVLATTMEGRLLRWEEASGWRPAVTAGPLTAARVFDVTVDDGGRALALAFPEALYTSTDNGATWAPAGTPTIGARSLGHAASGEPAALGMFESLVWRAGSGTSFARGTEKVHAREAALDVEVGRAPSGGAVQAGRAVLDGDRYYEVVRPENEGESWQLARGRIDGRLEAIPLTKSEKCGNVRLGARGKTVFIVCVAQDGPEIGAEVRRSTDQGTTWSEGLKLVTPDTDQINVAVSPDGGALIVGLCRAESTGGCKPGAPVRVRRGPASLPDGGAPDAGAEKGDALHAQVAVAPQLQGAALLPTFSPDGRSAYFLGRRGKDERLHLFVSHDGGESFSPRVLEGPGGQRPARVAQDDDEGQPEPEGPDTFEVDEQSALRVGDDGTIGMLLPRSRGDTAYVLADEDGRVIQVSAAPSEVVDEERGPTPVIMSGHGRRVLALSLVSPESGPVLWESFDGGATWDRQIGPQALAREFERGQPAIACALGGCLVGETVTRLGWGASGAPPEAQAPTTPDPSTGGTPHVRTPIVCELGKAPWARIENAIGGLSYAVAIPGVHEVMRGRSVWSTMTLDPRTNAIGSVSAVLPESGEGEPRIVTRSMLGPIPGGQHMAIAISATQHEGFAAVRVAVPVDAKKHIAKLGAPMRNVEVAWENFLEGTSVRARIPDAGVIEAGDVELGDPASPRGTDEARAIIDVLKSALISITSRGVFVHPHAKSRGSPAFFVDASGRAERYEPHTWPTSSLGGGVLDLRGDASAVNGSLFDVGLSRDHDGEWGALALALRGGAGTAASNKPAALGLLPPRASIPSLSAYTSWAWAAKAPVGISATVIDTARLKAWSHFIGFRPDGTFLPAEPVPTMIDLGERPRPCSTAERAGTPRVVTPFFIDSHALFPGTRHVVLVREPKQKGAAGLGDEIVLLTSGAVIQGTVASPCISAWEAPALGHAGMAAVLPGDLGHAWMFRFSYDAPRAAGKRTEATPVAVLEYRPMACRYDPTAHPPEQVWGEPGTTRP
jgi:hypothetical protein